MPPIAVGGTHGCGWRRAGLIRLPLATARTLATRLHGPATAVRLTRVASVRRTTATGVMSRLRRTLDHAKRAGNGSAPGTWTKLPHNPFKNHEKWLGR